MPMYNSFKSDSLIGTVSISADAYAGQLRVILLSGSYTGNITTHTRYRDLSAAEISIADPGRIVGYYSGGQAVSGSLVITQDNINNWGSFDAEDITWLAATITARYAALVKVRDNGLNKQNDNVIGYLDFGSDQSCSNGAFTIQWNSNGIILLT